MMRKSTFNLIVDATAFVIFAALAGTGFLLAYNLPPGSGGEGSARGHGAALVVWGLTRHQWGEVHLVLAFVLAALMALHLVNHWQWIRAMAKTEGSPSGGMRKGIALGAAALSLALIMLPFLLTPHKQGPESAGSGPLMGGSGRVASPQTAGGNVPDESGDELIYGALTIDELAQRTTLSVQRIGEILGLKTPAQGNERLGRLLRARGISMQDARRKLLQAIPTQPTGSFQDKQRD